jgi:predicted AlkP superfamily phosphohydrolase/phosphomutase
MYAIDSVTPTVSKLMKFDPPEGASAAPIKEIIEAAKGKTIKKILLYAPDAIGEWIFQAHKTEFKDVIAEAPIQIQVQSMTPSYTPVCYGSMFTGMKPAEHGIIKYMKPVLTVETLFDAASKAGLKVALAAVKDCSIDLIFRDRKIDYYTEKYDPEVNQRVLKLLEKDDYDLIVAYNQEYDDLMHDSTPTNPEAIEAFRRHLKAFKMLANAFNKRYSGVDRVIAFLPDHGTHVDPESGKGSHGTDSPDDMEVRHFWGVYVS